MQTGSHITIASSETDLAATRTAAIIAARLQMRSGPMGLLCRTGSGLVVTMEILACIDSKRLG